MAYANIIGYVKKWVILVKNWVGYMKYVPYISSVVVRGVIPKQLFFEIIVPI